MTSSMFVVSDVHVALSIECSQQQGPAGSLLIFGSWTPCGQLIWDRWALSICALSQSGSNLKTNEGFMKFLLCWCEGPQQENKWFISSHLTPNISMSAVAQSAYLFTSRESVQWVLQLNGNYWYFDLFSSFSIVQQLLAQFSLTEFDCSLYSGRGARTHKRCWKRKKEDEMFFGSVVAPWNGLSCLQCRPCCSVCDCQAPCHPAIVQARNQHRLPLFYPQICSYRLLCPISLHFVMLVKYSVTSQLW